MIEEKDVVFMERRWACDCLKSGVWSGCLFTGAIADLFFFLSFFFFFSERERYIYLLV